MDLGSSANTHFFTDTIFQDTDGNGAFTQNEAVPGIAIKLVIIGSLHSSFDVSSAVGSFAIPIQTIPGGAVVQVVVSNGTATSASLSIPKNASNLETLTIAPGESKTYGHFIKSSQVGNVGWRNVEPAQILPAAPTLSISRTVEGIVLEWASDEQLEYLPEGSPDLVSWEPLVPNFVPGTPVRMRYVEAPGVQNKFYRLQVRSK